MPVASPQVYRHDRFIARRQVFRFFGAGFTILAPDGTPLAASEQKAFKLKEDIRVNDGTPGGAEILRIQADRVVDWGPPIR